MKILKIQESFKKMAFGRSYFNEYVFIPSVFIHKNEDNLFEDLLFNTIYNNFKNIVIIDTITVGDPFLIGIAPCHLLPRIIRTML
jgi:hypothetical protein